MSAGLSILNCLESKIYDELEQKSNIIEKGILKNIKDTNFNAVVNRIGSMLTLFFTNKTKIKNYNDAKECDLNTFAKYFKIMLDNGIYLPPSQFESLFISNALSDDDIESFLSINRYALKSLKNE